jgi:hypothetical protein
LPVKQILQDYLGDDADEVVEETKEEEEKPVIKEEVVPALPALVVEEVKKVKEEVKEVVKEEVKEVVKEEVKEVKEEVNEVKETPKEPSPSVIKIDTEPAVHFSDYDAVFDETKGAPEMLFNPKDGDGDGDDFSSDALTIHDGPDTPLTADDAEDLDAPVPAVVKKDTIDDSDVVVLE